MLYIFIYIYSIITSIIKIQLKKYFQALNIFFTMALFLNPSLNWEHLS